MESVIVVRTGTFQEIYLGAKPFRKAVGAPRFELGTSWSRTKRATRLRYAPEKSGYREQVTGYSKEEGHRLFPVTCNLFPKLVGTARFELATPCTPSKCATRLRYVPPTFRPCADRAG